MKFLSLMLFFTSTVTAGYAATDTASTSETEVKVRKDKSDDKADQVITNRRMRASNGSLSNFSMNMAISYSGGSLSKPLAADRPNIAGAGDTPSIAGISGTVNGSYRINQLNRLNAGTGIQMLAPFNDSIDTSDERARNEFDENQGVMDVSNPYISYTHMNKLAGVQTILTVGLTEYTASNFRDAGYDNAITSSVNTMYDFGGSKFSVGALFVYNRYLFDDDSDKLARFQNETVWGFLPQAEYVINDTFNLRTIIRSNWYQNNRADGVNDFAQRPVTQSVGLGISLGRNVFLYPNIQFIPQDLQAASTNVGFTANINTF